MAQTVANTKGPMRVRTTADDEIARRFITAAFIQIQRNRYTEATPHPTATSDHVAVTARAASITSKVTALTFNSSLGSPRPPSTGPHNASTAWPIIATESGTSTSAANAHLAPNSSSTIGCETIA